jgi:hypothetical protein
MKDSFIRIALGLTAVSVLTVLTASLGEALPKPPISTTTNPGTTIDPDPVDPPPQPTPIPPLARPGIDILERKGTSLTIEWCDRSGEDDGHALFRGSSPANAEQDVVADLTPPVKKKGIGLTGTKKGQGGAAPPRKVGCYRYVDAGLASDTAYCYRLAPKQNGSLYMDYLSRPICAYTREAQSKPVWRAELELRTDSRQNNGTDDSVRIQLNVPPPIPAFDTTEVIPNGNMTWLDYGRDDFRRGAIDSYDLNLTSISERADIHQISFAIDGDDTWCMSGFSLFVNGVEVYNENYAPSCLQSEDWGTYQTNFYYVSHAELRAHPLWQAYQTPQLVDAAEALAALSNGQSVEVLTLPQQEIESRVEAIVGHSIHYNDLEWGDLVNLRHVEATATADPQVAHIDLDLEADVPVLDNPSVDIDFDLRFAMTCRADGTGIDFQFATENFFVDADAGLFTQFLGFLFCAVEGCDPAIVSSIESQVRAGFKPLARTISLQSAEAVGACALGYLPTVVVTDTADVVISIEPGSNPPPPSPSPTPRPGPYGPVKDVFWKPVRGLLTAR